MPRYALRTFGGAVRLSSPSSLPAANITLYIRGNGAPNATKVSIASVDRFSPINVGDTGNPLCVQILYGDGSIASILGATISMELQSATNPAIIKACTGQWVTDPTNNGKASFAYSAQDVNTVDLWRMWIKILIGNKPLHATDGAGNPKILEIIPLPAGA